MSLENNLSPPPLFWNTNVRHQIQIFFLHVFWVSNSGPHAYKASTLLSYLLSTTFLWICLVLWMWNLQLLKANYNCHFLSTSSMLCIMHTVSCLITMRWLFVHPLNSKKYLLGQWNVSVGKRTCHISLTTWVQSLEPIFSSCLLTSTYVLCHAGIHTETYTSFTPTQYQ